MTNLHYTANDDAYYEDAEGRYEEIREELETVVESEDQYIDRGEAAALGGVVAGWLVSRQHAHGLRPSGAIPQSPDDYLWFDAHIRTSYDAGAEFGGRSLVDAGFDVSTPGVERSPTHRHSLKEAFERQRNKWRRLQRDLKHETREAIEEAVREELPARQIIQRADDRLVKTGLDRSKRIATYESNWAYNRAALSEYKDAGAEGVEIDASVETAGDFKVCEFCAAREGETYSINGALDMMEEEPSGFPFHVGCRCRLVVSRRSS